VLKNEIKIRRRERLKGRESDASERKTPKNDRALIQPTGRMSAIAARSTRPMLTHCSAMGRSA
jgi:hypothetical protein